MQIILVEWAGHPLYRNESIDGKIVRCGLGRVLEDMSRYDPGVDVGVNIVINQADTASAEPLEPAGALLGRLQRVVAGRRRRHMERRMLTYARLPEQYSFIESVHFRSGDGQDFGAYDFGYQLLRERGYRGDVLFMTSSVAGPHEHGWILKYRGQFRRHPDVGLCGIGLNSHDTRLDDGPFAPHVQSYFLYSTMDVLERAIGPRLFDADAPGSFDRIGQGEIGMSERVLDAGYSITSPSFPEFAYRRGDPWAIPWGDLRFCRRLGLPIHAI